MSWIVLVVSIVWIVCMYVSPLVLDRVTQPAAENEPAWVATSVTTVMWSSASLTLVALLIAIVRWGVV